MSIEGDFPGLAGTDWEITSPPTKAYNCIAWAADDPTRWWWPQPHPMVYWPPSAPRDGSVETFIAAFGLLGYEVCPEFDVTLDERYDKLVLYTKDGLPTHMARQLPSGLWTSKCGGLEDIQHTLEGLCGDVYGQPTIALRRLKADTHQPPHL